MPGGRWTEAEIATLDEMRAAGFTWAKIATVVGRPDTSCMSFSRDRIRRLNRPIAPPKPRPEPKGIEPCERHRQALLRVIAGYANDNLLHIDEAAAVLLSGRQFNATLVNAVKAYPSRRI